MNDQPLRFSSDPARGADEPPARRGRAWYALLLLPFAGLLFPGLYARAEPALYGVPFFYWYQLAWVAASSAVTALVYARTRA